MNIILGDLLGMNNFVIPVVPITTKIDFSGGNESKDSIQGRLNVMGNPALRAINWSSVFPVNKNYDFVKRNSLSNGWSYVRFIELQKRAMLPVRLIVTQNDNTPISNFLATIDTFNWALDNVEDIQYTISLTEFRETFVNFMNRTLNPNEVIESYIRGINLGELLRARGLLQ